MCYFEGVSIIGLRELRQNASEILREVEAGEPATVTVAGRPVAQIVPLKADCWASWENIRTVFESPTDVEWDADLRAFGVTGLDDPWAR
jgi:prevent-host-death family protein